MYDGCFLLRMLLSPKMTSAGVPQNCFAGTPAGYSFSALRQRLRCSSLKETGAERARGGSHASASQCSSLS